LIFSELTETKISNNYAMTVKMRLERSSAVLRRNLLICSLMLLLFESPKLFCIGDRAGGDADEPASAASAGKNTPPVDRVEKKRLGAAQSPRRRRLLRRRAASNVQPVPDNFEADSP
jgi:hypothetical protein